MKGKLTADKIKLYIWVLIKIPDSILCTIGGKELPTEEFSPGLASHVLESLFALLDAGGCNVDSNHMTHSAPLPLQKVTSLPTG